MTATSKPETYGARLAALCWQGIVQLIRPPSHSRRAEAARTWAWRTLVLSAGTMVVIVALMVWIDAAEIALMPARGSGALWPVRLVSNFGKDEYVLAALTIVMLAALLLAPRVTGVAHATLVGIAARFQYLLLAVALSVLAGEAMKGMIGRGRPFVGDSANAFNFSHFSWTEAYASLPSGHATTSCALAFGVVAIWPRLRWVMFGYALTIMVTRLVLLAHHPSDVIGGALVGVTGAMMMRYWFAARRVVFIIREDGSIAARGGPSWPSVLRAARRAAIG